MSQRVLSSGVHSDKRRPHAIYDWGESLTIQSAKDECDINLIVARALKGADISHVNSRVARYGDFSNVPSYQEARDLVMRAEGMFAELPANVRERFANDPARMVEFLQDDNNYDEAVKLGLVVKKEKPAASNAAERASGVVRTPDDTPSSGKGKGKAKAEPAPKAEPEE